MIRSKLHLHTPFRQPSLAKIDPRIVEQYIQASSLLLQDSLTAIRGLPNGRQAREVNDNLLDVDAWV